MPTPLNNCCPTGFTYVDNTGMYYEPLIGAYATVSNNIGTSPTLAEVINKCVIFINRGFAATPEDTKPCPCCPDNYTYSGGICCPNGTNNCTSNLAVPTIPCISCVCTDPIEPTCNDCISDALPISFTLNTTSKACTDCNPNEGFRTLSNKSSAFMPYFIIDPIINFRLK